MHPYQTQPDCTPNQYPHSTVLSRNKSLTEPIQNNSRFTQTQQSNYIKTYQGSRKVDSSSYIQIQPSDKDYQSEESESGSQSQLRKQEDKDEQGKQNPNNFENLRVQFKNIQDYHQQKQLQTEAKRFVRRLKLEKQQYKGKFHLMKLKECRKKKEKQMMQRYQEEQRNQQRKEEKREQSLRKLSNIKKIANERQELLKKYHRKSPRTQQSHSIIHRKSELSPLAERDLPLGCIKRNQIGNKYMNQYGKRNNKYRSYSVATERERQLLTEQQYEIDNLRNKIRVLKSMMKG